MSIGAVLLYFLMPAIVIISGIFFYRRYKETKEWKSRNKEKAVKNLKSDIKNSEEEKEKLLTDIELEPEDKGRFSSLALNFDETGRVKN